MPNLQKIFPFWKLRKHSHEKAIEKMLATIAMLEKKSAFIKNQIKKERELTVENGRYSKKLAFESLIKKKTHERQLRGVVGALNAIKCQLETLQASKLNNQVVAAIQSGVREQKKVNKYLSPIHVDTILNEIMKQKDVTNEMERVFKENGVGNQTHNAKELLFELRRLEVEEFENKLPTPPNFQPKIRSDYIFQQSPRKQLQLQSRTLCKEHNADDDEAGDVKRLQNWSSKV